MDVSSAATESCGLSPSPEAVCSKGEIVAAPSGRVGFVAASTMDLVQMRQFRRGGNAASDSFAEAWISDDPIDEDVAASDDRLSLSGWRSCRLRIM